MITVLAAAAADVAGASESVAVSGSLDLYSRYIWRGTDIGNSPSIQPALSASYRGFELGAWGAYAVSAESSDGDEIDFWLSYSRDFESGFSAALLATDYYFPNAGVDFFNFNDYDDVDDEGMPDPGAHTLELGLSVSGPEAFPLTVSAYVNVHNDAGNNTYFQLDYPLAVGETDLGLFLGATGGSSENPEYYGADDFSVINLGVTAGREITVSDSMSLPLEFSWILNPEAEVSYLIVGVSF